MNISPTRCTADAAADGFCEPLVATAVPVGPPPASSRVRGVDTVPIGAHMLGHTTDLVAGGALGVTSGKALLPDLRSQCNPHLLPRHLDHDP